LMATSDNDFFSSPLSPRGGEALVI